MLHRVTPLSRRTLRCAFARYLLWHYRENRRARPFGALRSLALTPRRERVSPLGDMPVDGQLRAGRLFG